MKTSLIALSLALSVAQPLVPVHAEPLSCDVAMAQSMKTLVEKQAISDQDRAKKRADADAKKEAQRVAMEKKKTDLWKEATERELAKKEEAVLRAYVPDDVKDILQTYRNEIEVAMTKRKNATKTIQKNYQVAIDLALQARRTSVDQARESRRAVINSAYDAWVTTCTQDPKADAVFQKQVQSTQKTFANVEKKALAVYTSAITSIAKKRVAAVKDADAQFRKDVKAALDHMKKDLKPIPKKYGA